MGHQLTTKVYAGWCKGNILDSLFNVAGSTPAPATRLSSFALNKEHNEMAGGNMFLVIEKKEFILKSEERDKQILELRLIGRFGTRQEADFIKRKHQRYIKEQRLFNRVVYIQDKEGVYPINETLLTAAKEERKQANAKVWETTQSNNSNIK